MNVDLLRLIQLGITFADETGALAATVAALKGENATQVAAVAEVATGLAGVLDGYANATDARQKVIFGLWEGAAAAWASLAPRSPTSAASV